MPYKPKHPCSYPSCPKLTNERYCPEHKKLMTAQYDNRYRNRDVSEFYHSREWRHLRKVFLTEHPFCTECWKKGKLTEASVVDHVVPIRQGGPALNENNLQALCASCHSSKSIKEGSRFGGNA